MNGENTFKTSAEIGEIAAALAKAQADYPAIKKDKEADAGTYKYKYADLGDVLSKVLPVLAKNGLALIQPTIIEAGTIFLRSRVLHTSGQWIESEFPVAAYSGARHQQIGAALSYARRYAACSLLSIAAEEDTDADSSIGDAKPKAERKPREAPQVVQNAPGLKPLPPVVGSEDLSIRWFKSALKYIAEAEDPETLKTWWKQNQGNLAALDDDQRRQLGEAKDVRKEQLVPSQSAAGTEGRGSPARKDESLTSEPSSAESPPDDGKPLLMP